MKLARPAVWSICLLAGAAGCSLGEGPAAAGPVVTPSIPSAVPQAAPSTTSTTAPAVTTSTTRPVAAPPSARRLDAFQTPSGNIACATWPEDDGSVRCDISQYSYAPPPRPDYCDTDWGGAFLIEPDAGVEVLCAGDTVYSLDLPKPAAGTSVVIGRSVCSVRTRSVECVVSETDGGLFLSPERYRTF